MAKQDLDKTLADLFDAERQVRKLHAELVDAPTDPLLLALKTALTTAQSESDEEEAAMRLERIAKVLGQLEGPQVVDMLIDVLNCDFGRTRDIAEDELTALAFDRFKEVAQGIERALERLATGSPALAQLPWVLAPIPEPAVKKLMGRFLDHEDPYAVGGAIQAIVDLGDDSYLPAVERLAGDMRTLEYAEDEDDEPTEVTIADLVDDALDILKGGDDELEESETKH